MKIKLNSQQEQEKIIRKYINSYNNFDVKGMINNLHNDIFFENISNGEINLMTKGINEFHNQAELAKEYFKQREQKILKITFINNSVEVEIDYAGILNIDFPNGLKKGDKLQLRGKSIFKFKDDKIIEIKDIS